MSRRVSAQEATIQVETKVQKHIRIMSFDMFSFYLPQTIYLCIQPTTVRGDFFQA